MFAKQTRGRVRGNHRAAAYYKSSAVPTNECWRLFPGDTRLIRSCIDTIGGIWALAWLGVQSGFRMNGPYWRWRRETAFGSDPEQWPSARERRKTMLEYGRWVFRMRRLR